MTVYTEVPWYCQPCIWIIAASPIGVMGGIDKAAFLNVGLQHKTKIPMMIGKQLAPSTVLSATV